MEVNNDLRGLAAYQAMANSIAESKQAEMAQQKAAADAVAAEETAAASITSSAKSNDIQHSTEYEVAREHAVVPSNTGEKIPEGINDRATERVQDRSTSTDSISIADQSANLKKLAENTTKKHAEMQSQNLDNVLTEMLDRQINSSRYANNANDITSKFNLGGISQSQAIQNISGKGPYGVEAVADRVAETALAITEEDNQKLELMRETIVKGFINSGMRFDDEQKAQKLAQVSLDTYYEIMDRLDYAAENKMKLDGYEEYAAQRRLDDEKIEETVIEQKEIEERVNERVAETIQIAEATQNYSIAQEATSNRSAANAASEVVATNMS